MNVSTSPGTNFVTQDLGHLWTFVRLEGGPCLLSKYAARRVYDSESCYHLDAPIYPETAWQHQVPCLMCTSLSWLL